MPAVGAADITVGALILFRPTRVVLVWAAFWCLWTAILRPASGETLWEIWERAGNFGPPLTLLMMAGGFSFRKKDLFGRIEFAQLSPRRLDQIEWSLRIWLALLLAGHAGFCFFLAKPMLIAHWARIGVAATPEGLALQGLVEFGLAVAVLVRPTAPLLWVVLIWKVFTEMLYPMSGNPADIFEFIERWGDYGIPAALIVIARGRKRCRA